MNVQARKLFGRCWPVLGLVLAGSLGCVSSSMIRDYMRFEPEPAPLQIPAVASVEVSHTTDPAVAAAWKKWAWNLDSINGDQIVAEALYRDFTGSGLFKAVQRQTAGADVLVVVRSRDSRPDDFRLEVSLELLEPKSRQPVLSYTRQKTYATGVGDYRFKETLRELLGQLRADLAADYKSKDLSRLGGPFAVGGAPVTGAAATPVGLEPLLVSQETSIGLARQRNRALVSFKALELPAVLRQKSSSDLTALAVRVEQTILDLNHEAALENDRAQRAAETNPRTVEEHRELAIAYKERIELLKPIGTAIKEEIANRGK